MLFWDIIVHVIVSSGVSLAQRFLGGEFDS